jgi:exodeoxyribonuclease V alpha subunit
MFSNLIFSGSIIIKKIHTVINCKWQGSVIYNRMEYTICGPYYNWINEQIIVFAYGVIYENRQHIDLETIIPDLATQEHLFTVFLLSMKIQGLSKIKIDLLYKAFGERLYTLFFQNKFDIINTILKYENDKLAVIIKKWQEIGVYCLLHVDLIQLGLSAKSIKKVYKTYKEKSIEVIKNNPYQMIESIGFGFKTVDKIALECGIEQNNIIRIESGLLFILEENEIEGNTYLIKEILYERAFALLKIEDNKILDIAFSQLIEKKRVINYNNKYVGKYDSYQYDLYILQFLIKNKKNASMNLFFDDSFLSTEQKKAVIGALENKYTVITGSAGTGKSTVIKSIYQRQIENKKKVIVLTPTGRASQRIKEIDPSIETMTIYKALTRISIYKVLHNKEIEAKNYLQFDHLIIDECSMIDSKLLYVILKMTLEKTNITFLGDSFQLPPIGIGDSFSLLIEYQSIPIYYLTQIFRQRENTSLLTIAKEVAQGVYPKISSSQESDCFFKMVKKEEIYDFLTSCVDRYYNKKNNMLEIQCITFLNRGRCGVTALNIFIQKYLYQKYRLNQPLFIFRFYKYDKVVVLKNNYDLDVRNGEIGIVMSGDDNEIVIHFAHDKIVVFSIAQSNLLQLAYVINVYKSQGSEFENVIIFLYMEQYILLNKKALYTALTRAKQRVMILGDRKALYCAINNKNNYKRNTFFELFLIDRRSLVFRE